LHRKFRLLQHSNCYLTWLKLEAHVPRPLTVHLQDTSGSAWPAASQGWGRTAGPLWAALRGLLLVLLKKQPWKILIPSLCLSTVLQLTSLQADQKKRVVWRHQAHQSNSVRGKNSLVATRPWRMLYSHSWNRFVTSFYFRDDANLQCFSYNIIPAATPELRTASVKLLTGGGVANHHTSFYKQ